VKGKDVPSITVDPLLEFARATPGQVPPSADPKWISAPLSTAPRQVVPTSGKSTPSSALGVAPAPKALRIKKIGFKKS
jgi:hypothetical protein